MPLYKNQALLASSMSLYNEIYDIFNSFHWILYFQTQVICKCQYFMSLSGLLGDRICVWLSCVGSLAF